MSVNGHTTFHVDLDRAPELLAELGAVREKYEKIQDVALELKGVQPPFVDDATVGVFRELGARAQGGDGDLYRTTSQMISWIDGFKAAVAKALDEYQRIDDENRAG
ncbi:hypothetical protein [Saccharopolyspora taberi]|uniref:PE domain-containing protein n=1 Tax=Saccharopolyspora taberi TaxID=60895 RepID=A0ABN3VBR1_9PSEU